MSDSLARQRFSTIMLGGFSLFALILAVVGVYGVMSNAVAQQRQEIGVRMALGASSGTIARMILARGSRLLGAGLVVGLAGSIILARMLAQKVWNITAFDPIAFTMVSLVVLAAGIQACLWPAWRASRIDPIMALREN